MLRRIVKRVRISSILGALLNLRRVVLPTVPIRLRLISHRRDVASLQIRMLLLGTSRSFALLSPASRDFTSLSPQASPHQAGKPKEADARRQPLLLVLPTGFEPAIFAVRGRCPKPLDDGSRNLHSDAEHARASREAQQPGTL